MDERILAVQRMQDYIENKCAYGCKWFELKVSK